MSLIIADFTPEFGIISGENHWIRKDGTVDRGVYKVRQYGRYAVGCCGNLGLCEAIHGSLNALQIPDGLDYDEFQEVVEHTAVFTSRFYRQIYSKKTAPVAVVVLGYSEVDACVRAALIEFADESHVRIRERGPVLATGVDVSKAVQWLRDFHRANVHADVAKVVDGHADLYKHLSAENVEIGASPVIFTVTKDGINCTASPDRASFAANPDAAANKAGSGVYIWPKVDQRDDMMEHKGNLKLKNVLGIVDGTGDVGYVSANSSRNLLYVGSTKFSKTVTTHGNPVQVMFQGAVGNANTTTHASYMVAIYRDGHAISTESGATVGGTPYLAMSIKDITRIAIDNQPAGQYTYEIRCSAGTLGFTMSMATMQIIELG